MITSGPATTVKTIYGWQDGETWFLSRFPASVDNRAANRYSSKSDAETHAQQRKLKINWEGDV